jgi:hypothetical protein
MPSVTGYNLWTYVEMPKLRMVNDLKSRFVLPEVLLFDAVQMLKTK